MPRTDRKSKRKNHDKADESFKPVMVDVSAPSVDPQAPEEPETASDTASKVESGFPSDADRPIITRDLSPATGDDAEWPVRDWPASVGRRGTGYQVIIKRSVLNDINRHGKTTSEVEVCGVMAGNVYRDEAGPYLYVDACVVGEKAGHSAAQVTFTAETWTHIQGVMDADHPDRKMVGWYHTHPGFGIFLSDMDLFIHGNFFNLPWQIAFVYDPVSGEEGLFIWREGKTERVHFFIEEDVEKEIVIVPVSPETAAAALADFSVRVQQIEKQQKAVWIGVALLALVAVAWPFVLYTIMSDKPRPTVAPNPRNSDAGRPYPEPIAPRGNTSAVQPAPTAHATEAGPSPTTQEQPAKVLPATLPAHVDAPQPLARDAADGQPILVRPTKPTTNGARVLEP